MEAKQKRTVHYSFKATEAEDRLIRQKMKHACIRNRSAYIRAMALNGYVLRLDLPELHEAVRLLGKLSGNVNQIARRLNEGGSVYETEIDDVQTQQRKLHTMLSRLLQQLERLNETLSIAAAQMRPL